MGHTVKFKIHKTDEQWRHELDPEQFRVTRKKGTEPAFTGAYWDSKQDGVYRCVCCDNPLFRSADKFDSGSGWPSFTSPSAEDGVVTIEDPSHGMRRVEVMCAACGAHLGHVFPDGPRIGPGAGGLRYCINSASLHLDPENDAGD